MLHNHHDLFHSSDIFDHLSLFQSLLDSRDLTADQAFALLHTIRLELETPQAHRSMAYTRYGQVMESLHREMPDVYEQLVNAWKTKRGIVQVQERTTAESTPAEESERFWDEDDHVAEKPRTEIHAAASANEPKTGTAVGVGEAVEETGEHGEAEEAEEEHEEAEEKAETEQDENEEKEVEGAEAGEGEEDGKKEEAENENEEEPEEKEDEESEDKEQEEREVEAEPEEPEKEAEKEESEEAEPEDASEAEGEVEKESESSESETESQEESDHMISEAAEAAAELEHASMEIEPEEIESPGEEEPPMEAGE